MSVVLIVAGFAVPLATHELRTRDHALLVHAVQLGALLAVFGACLRSVPGPPRRRRSVALEPPRGPLPVWPRWHTATLTSREPGRPELAIPPRCPCCGDPEVTWLQPLATKERGGLTAAVVTLGMPPIVGDLFGRAITEVDVVQVATCEPCLALVAARERSRVLLRALCASVAAVALGASLVGHGPPLGLSLVGVATLLVAAYGLHTWRFSARRARPTSLASAASVEGSLTPLASGFGPVRWRLVVHACDPTWLAELVDANAPGWEAAVDPHALRFHADELRRAGLR